jgi:hypothetical protein
MAGTAAPRLIRQQRHRFAVEQLAKGHPFTAVVAAVADEWGCSRRRARDVVNQALAELVDDTEVTETKQLMADNIRRLQRIAMRAEQCGQYAAAVGAVRSLHEFCVEPKLHRMNDQSYGRSRPHA